MAAQISSDIATEVDIIVRKKDSFYLKVTLTKADGSVYNFSTYNIAELLVTNANDSSIREFLSKSDAVTLPKVASAISIADAATGELVISTAGGNMDIPKGSYVYVLSIENTDANPNEKITLMYGKFKVN